MTTPEIVPDSQHRGLVGMLPASIRPFALLARFDRPIGWWLLYWPCAWGVALSGKPDGGWWLLLWLLIGAIAMRGAGCVYNDIADRKLDASVERTRSRPLASGQVSLRAAWIWLLILVAIGFAVWWHINLYAKGLALLTLPLVAIYPFMKRITWWPQAWLGLVFGSGAVVGFAAADAVMFEARWWPMIEAMAALYGGAILWVIGYDTIYALQDREDDALVGIRSSARRLGGHVKAGVAAFYVGALAFWGGAIWLIRPDVIALAALFPVALHFAWQVATLVPDDGDNALAR
ncbi:MAG: 4-hydroxybenzoate octaprenyltransferase, partial [Sphingomonas bacterium]